MPKMGVTLSIQQKQRDRFVCSMTQKWHFCVCYLRYFTVIIIMSICGNRRISVEKNREQLPLFKEK